MSPTPPRVVVDPGILIAGFISTEGTTARLLDAILDRRAIAIISPRLIRELRTVLLRDKFRQYASVEDVDAFVVRLLARSDLVDDPRTSSPSPETQTTTTSSRSPEPSRTPHSSPETKTSSPSTCHTSMS